MQLPELTVPRSCGVQLKTYNHAAADLDQVRVFGAAFVRRGFIWEAIEKEAGVYDFSAYDRLVSDCRERGLSILGCMAFGNKLYGSVLEEKGREGYARFAAALAQRYKDDNIIWEIWNEPNTRTFWGKHGQHNSEQYAREYVELVKAVVPAMKQANPDIIVLGGSVSGLWSASYEWQDHCFAMGVLNTGIDAWSVHPYSTKSPEDVIDGYAKVRQMMVSHGGSETFPLLNSERGYPLGKAEGHAGGDPQKSSEYQAWHFVRQYMVDLLCGVQLTIWYEWSGKEGFSLVHGDQKSQAYLAGKVMLELLDGYRLEGRIGVQRPRDFILRFVNDKTGGVTLVAWTAPPVEATPDQATPRDVRIPVDVTGPVATVQIYGDTGAAQVHDGAITVALTGAPQYLILNPGQ